jgi:hypothetical protein
MPTLVAPFGPQLTPRDTPDPGSIAEEVFGELVERCQRLNVDPGDTAALLVVDLVASLVAYNRAPLGIIMAVIAEAAPIRAQLLIEANQRGEPRPPLNIAKIGAIAPHVCRLH